MQTIAVDIDDVLAANAEGFVKFSNERWGTSLTIDDYDDHWAEVWGVDHIETANRVLEMEIAQMQRNFGHFSGAKDVLIKLSKDYRLIVITSRRLSVKQDTEDWIRQYFSNIFSDVHYSGLWENIKQSSNELTKANIALELGADYLIDDQLKHCLACAKLGVKSLLFGDYSWNQIAKLPKNVTRVNDWAKVEDYFYGGA